MLTEEGKAEIKALFDSLDKDGDGKVSGKEWGSKVYQNQDIMSKYFGGSTLQEIGQAFNRIDSNGDDQLTWEEFEVATTQRAYSAELQLAKAISTAEGKEDLKALWDTLDKDGDGKISGKEWGSSVYKNQDIMKKYFGGSTLSEIGQAFNKIDTNGDDLLTWDELTLQAGSYLAANNLTAAMLTEEGKAEIKALFDSLDKDGDGKVSGKEWGSKVYQNQDIMSKYFGGSTLQEIGQAFNRIDSNGDDQLTWEEFSGESAAYALSAKLASAMRDPAAKAELKALFDSLDADSDGKVSGKEWGSKVYEKQDLMKKFFGGATLSEIGQAFNRIDTSGDDQLTWDEFEAAY